MRNSPSISRSNITPVDAVPVSIPNIEKKISDLIAKYRAESMDIDDIEYEEPDIMDWDSFREIGEKDTDNGFAEEY